MKTTILDRPGRQFGIKDPWLRKEASKLRDVLRNLDMRGKRIKSATLGGDPESSFEQAFANLAYTYIKDKAPRLLDFMTGFQLVDRNDDNTKAVGVFGFHVGNQWVYAPVFFLNSDLKGHELLYLKDQDLFVPMKENWVNYLMSKKPHILGEPEPQNLQQLGVLQPDIRSMSIPPYHSKYGSARVDIPVGWPAWAVEMLPSLGSWATDRLSEKYAGLDSRMSLPKLMGESLALTKVAMRTFSQYPELNRLCKEIYGDDFVKHALLELRAKAVEAGRPRALGEYSTPGALRKSAAGPAVEISVQTDVSLSKNSPELTEAEQERLLRDGVLVRDHRNGDEVSKAYDVQIKTELVNPDASGIYDMLVKPGRFQEVLVINEPSTAKGKKDFATVVRTDNGKAWLNVHRTRLWVRPDKRTREEQNSWLESRTSASLSEGGTYVVVSRSYSGSLEGSTPFTVKKSFGDGRYKVIWHDYADRGRPTAMSSRFCERDDFGNWERDRELHGDADLLYMNEREGSRFKSQQGMLFVPPEAKVVSVEDPYDPYPDSDLDVGPAAENRSESEALDPGTIADVQAEILQKSAGLKLWTDGNDISINSGPLKSKQAGLIELIRDYGFREKTARHLIRETEINHHRGKPSFFRVKYAQGYPMLGPGPGAPSIPPQEYGYDGSYGGIPTTQMQTDFQGVPEASAGLTDTSVYDSSPEAMPDPMVMQQAQQAAQMGQKEVFDTSMISGLLRAVRQDTLVDRYMGDLMKALDRLGRILFQFYWHNDEFMDRYGKSDMPELEDTLRNAFEVVGDLVLFLKEKDVDAMPGMELSSPTVEQTAE